MPSFRHPWKLAVLALAFALALCGPSLLLFLASGFVFVSVLVYPGLVSSLQCAPFAIPAAERHRVVTYDEFRDVAAVVRAWNEDVDERGVTRIPKPVIPPNSLPALVGAQRREWDALRAQQPWSPDGLSHIQHYTLECLAIGITSVAGAVCRIQMGRSVGTGFRVRDHRYVIITNSHCVHDRAALLAASFTFLSFDGSAPIRLLPCASGAPPDRECYKVVLPESRGFARGMHRPDIAVIRFFPDSANARLLDQLENEPLSQRVWPSLLAHYEGGQQVPSTQPTAAKRRQSEVHAARWCMPVADQSVALVHHTRPHGVRAEAVPTQISFAGRVIRWAGSLTDSAAQSLAGSRPFIVLLHDLFCGAGASGSPLIGPDGELVAVHFGRHDGHNAAVMLTEEVRHTLTRIFLGLRGLSDRGRATLTPLLADYQARGVPSYAFAQV
jgi:hypothetical protein